MKFSDVKIGEFYLYDRNNISMQMENAINVVKAVEKFPEGIFKMNGKVRCLPVRMSTGQLDDEYPIEVYPNMLTPLEEDIRRNFIIRYPIDLPVFNDGDVQTIDEIVRLLHETSRIANIDLGVLTEAKVSSLTAKIKFYQGLATTINNGLPHEVGD